MILRSNMTAHAFADSNILIHENGNDGILSD